MSHERLCDLLEDIPGVVLLHGFFLSEIQAHRDLNGSKPNAWIEALYDSHGYLAVQSRFHETDLANGLHKYPCNFDVLKKAHGIIVHSNDSVNLAQDWYNHELAHKLTSIPPPLKSPCKEINGNSTRRKLRYTKDDFVVTCFGKLNPTHKNHRLLSSWYNSKMSESSKCHLIFVGEKEEGEYGKDLLEIIKNSDSNSKVLISGWVDRETFRDYLSISDLSVQLRGFSHGETCCDSFKLHELWSSSHHKCP